MPSIHRRSLLAAAPLLGVPVLGAAQSPGSSPSAPGTPAAIARAPSQRIAPPAIAQARIGRVTISFLSDGFIDAQAGWFTGLPERDIAQRISTRLGGDGRTLRLNATAWLIDDGERLVLLDAGWERGALPSAGRLPAALRALGVAPADIEMVAITHMHADHIGGLLDEQGATFPNAQLLLPRADAVTFADATARAAAPAVLQDSFAVAARVRAAYPRAQLIDGERSLTPFVSTVDLRGHTPGHTGFRIEDGGRSLLIVGDALFDPALHPASDAIGIVFETDAEAARAMRTRLFARAQEERALLAATHLPFPGLGRIEGEGSSLVWRPSDFPLA